MPDQNIDRQIRDSFRAVLSRVRPTEFHEVAPFEDVGGEAYFESRRWMLAVFGPDREPHSEALRAKHYFHLWQPPGLDFDLLRHIYQLGARVLTVTESVPLVAVDVRLADDDSAAKLCLPDRASAIANETFQLPRPIRFLHGGAEGSLVNDAGCGERRIDMWTDCIFATSLPEGVRFLIHKRDPKQRSRPRNFSIWFDDDFRNSRQVQGAK